MAASQGQFQLFPTMQPQNRPNYSHPRRQRERSIRSPNMSPVLEDAKPSGQTDAVILKIIEDTNTLMAPSQAAPSHPPRSGSPASASNSSSRETEIQKSSQTPQTRVSPSTSPTSRSLRTRSPMAVPNARAESSPLSTSNSVRSIAPPLHVKARGRAGIESSCPNPEMRSSPTASETPESKAMDSTRGKSPPPANPDNPPPIPMRSIFPRYDPNIRLSQQHYYPQGGRLGNLPNQNVSRADYKHSTSLSMSSNDGKLQLGSNEDSYIASSEELAQLWDITSGEASRSNIGTFHMRLRRTDQFTYTLGGDSIPFYVLKTNNTNDFELHKTHPSKPNTKSPIVTLNLGEVDDGSSADVCIPLFPRLAEILAREQSLESARRHQLNPTDAMEAENTAVQRVKACETCTLEWKPVQTQYDLFYKALKGPRHMPETTRILSLSNETANSRLQASVSSSSGSVGSTAYPPTILITVPDQTRNGSSVSPRSNESPLVALDLENMSLSILASSILPTISSLYSVDILVAAILTVAVSNESTKPFLANMDIYEPKAEDFPDPYRPTATSPRQSTTTAPSPYFTGKIIATQAEREDAEQEASLMRQIHSQEPRRKSLKSFLPWKGFSSGLKPKSTTEVEEIELEAGPATKPKSKRKKDKKNPVKIEEIDIEHYGGFGDSSSHSGEKLPRPTRAALKLLFWVFSLIAWVLNVSVKFLAWVLVGITRCVSSGKA